MTDKEKRILFIEINPRGQGACPLLDMSCDLAPVCVLTNREAHCKECRKGMTRAEAVEGLAKVQWDRDRKHNSALNKDIVMPPWDEVERPSPSTELYLQDAQAALDALIK